MKKKLLSLVALICVFAFVLVMAGCSGSKEGEDAETKELTMIVGLGYTGGTYYQELHDAILAGTGIDVKLVKFNTADTSSKILDMLDNGETPADIIIVATRTPDDIQKKAFLSLSDCSSIATHFTETTVQRCTVENAVYQLPFGSTLVGIEYNKTLFAELGWELPKTFEDMVALKAKADEAGIPFAYTADCLTGAAMIHLMNVIGTEYIASPAGTEWFNNFLSGSATTSEIEDAFNYFKEFCDAGLFGNVYYDNWSFTNDYKQHRALFCFEDICRTSDGYQGPELDDDGNETGKQLDDEYGVMPFISKDGSNNCFSACDLMNVSLAKRLGDEGNEDKLAKALSVLEFMVSDAGIKVQTDIYRDSYVATKNFTSDDNRLYSDYSKEISEGFIMQRYALMFDNETIVSVGGIVRDYLAGINGASLDGVLEALKQGVSNSLTATKNVIATVPETLSFEETAKFCALNSATALQSAIDAAGADAEVQVSLMPYINSFFDLPTTENYGAIQAKIYAGDFTENHINMTTSATNNKPVGIYMTGAEIKAIVAAGFNKATIDFGHEGYEPMNYICLTKGDMTLEDGSTYLVAVTPACLLDETYNSYFDAGKVLFADADTMIQGKTADAIASYCKEHSTIETKDFIWK